MDFEYDGADDLGGRILWPRVAVLGIAILFFFLLGRCSAGGGIDPEQLATAESEAAAAQALVADREADITQLQQTIGDLREQLAVASGTTGLDGTTPTTPTDTATTGTTPPVGGQVYVVQPGDTLSDIAEAVYGDPLAFGVIATANGITETNPLQVGQELQIPANPDG